MHLSHEPIYHENSETKNLAVFIHGFMGTPHQFDGLAESVHSLGFSTAALLLPGHGSTVKDFSSTKMERWQSHVNAEIERFSRSHQKIYLVGHSMGCLLAINAAVKHSSSVCGLFLIAGPFKLRFFSFYSTKIRLKLLFYRRSHPMKSEYLAASSVPLRPSLVWRVIKPYFELKKLARLAKGRLQDIRVPVKAVYSKADDLVATRGLEILKAGLTHAPFEYEILSDSLHVIFPEHEQRKIIRLFHRLLGEDC